MGQIVAGIIAALGLFVAVGTAILWILGAPVSGVEFVIGVNAFAMGAYLYDLLGKLDEIKGEQERIITNNAFTKLMVYNLTYGVQDIDHALKHNPSLFTEKELNRLTDALKDIRPPKPASD